ncbi:unnamed protein product [Dracunculus medinensis]|uniref:Mediator of RNA polymerase II transcription subunit 7 n=1 Tax=Dracunculus medinensis TaxID=318479 RepID=A0A0N4UDJ9_DRAME|nr:unnamed protein product [Dracunculus medinensis]
MTILLKPNDRRHHQNSGDPLQLLQYCEQILSKIVEIRIRIDRPKPPKIIDKNEFIAMMADPTPYVKPAELLEKEALFENRRKKLVQISTALKRIEWMAAVSDPRNFRNLES